MIRSVNNCNYLYQRKESTSAPLTNRSARLLRPETSFLEKRPINGHSLFIQAPSVPKELPESDSKQLLKSNIGASKFHKVPAPPQNILLQVSKKNPSQSTQELSDPKQITVTFRFTEESDKIDLLPAPPKTARVFNPRNQLPEISKSDSKIQQLVERRLKNDPAQNRRPSTAGNLKRSPYSIKPFVV